MPDFRVAEDEQRYQALKTEMYLRLATSGAPPQVVSEILRNFGKMEQLAFYEGVRQGMVAAMLGPLDGPGAFERHQHPALSVHRDFYGTASTPLVRVEKDMVTKYGADAAHPWLDATPVEHPPTTLAEAMAAVGGAIPIAAAPVPQTSLGSLDIARAAGAAVRTKTAEEMIEALATSQAEIDDIIGEWERMNAESLDDQRPVESPDLLDRVREHLLDRKGWMPKDWTELILGLHRGLMVDAPYLDQMLASPSGMTVLSQVGFTHLHPGASVVVNEDGSFGGID